MSRQSSCPEEPKTRRTEGVRCRGRAARVVQCALDATAEELGRVGFAALRVEDVAARAGVNKTTIYRRWPTKTELVKAALVHALEEPFLPDTGCLGEDLRLMLGRVVERVSCLHGRGVVRMIQSERLHPEFAELVRNIRDEHNAIRCAAFERAMARGEIPPDSDPRLLVELMMAPLMSRLLYLDIEADPRFVDVLVDATLAVAKSDATAPRSPRARNR